MPARRGLLPLADVADRERRDGGPERVIRRKHPVIPVPVLARRWHEIGEPVEKLKWREIDDATGARPRGLPPPPPPDLGGRLVPLLHVADAGDAAVWTAGHGKPLERKRRFRCFTDRPSASDAAQPGANRGAVRPPRLAKGQRAPRL
jgi:hypothetical protein